MVEHIHQMIVIIDFYFSQLRPAYDTFNNLLAETNVSGGEFNLYDPEYRQKYLRLCKEAERFKKAIVELSRAHSLLELHVLKSRATFAASAGVIVLLLAPECLKLLLRNLIDLKDVPW